MTKRRQVALGISAGVLALGATLAHLKITIGFLLTALVMVFHIIFAVLIPGTTAESWWKPAFLVSGLAYATVWYLYALFIGYCMGRFGILKTPKELEQAAAQEKAAAQGSGEAAPAPGGKFGKLATYAAAAAFIVFIAWLQGKQADDFMEKSKVAALQHCGQDSACTQNVQTHFDVCYEANHESHKSGKFNHKHSLNEMGFNACLALYRPSPQQAAESVESATHVSEEGADSAESAPAVQTAGVRSEPVAAVVH